MLRLVIVAVLFGLAAAAEKTEDSNKGLLQWKVSDSERAKEAKDSKAPADINTPHIPGNLGSLGLTTGELKLFSGHALNLIKAQCPNVNHHTLFKLHKFIGKRISQTEPVKGENQQFATLLGNMMDCSVKAKAATMKEALKNKVVAAGEGAKSDEVMVMPGVVVQLDKETKTVATSKPITDVKVEVEAQPKQEVKKKWADMTQEEKEKTIGSLFHHNEPPKKSAPKPEPTRVTTRKPKSTRSPISEWFSSIFHTVTNFFRSIFGGGLFRARRAAGPGEPEIFLTVWKSSAAPEGSVEDNHGADGSGRQAFLTLLDEVCRIYCDTCNGQGLAKEFKIAAKELLQFLLKEDTTGLDLAATHYLNHEFIQSIQEC